MHDKGEGGEFMRVANRSLLNRCASVRLRQVAMLTAALGGLLFVAAASAGQSTVVRPNPLLASAAVGESVVVTLYVQDVQNLYGADIGLSFDPAVLEVVDANPSVAGMQIQPLDTFLKPDFVVTAKACNVVDPADPDCAVAGRVRYVATQVNPSLPASGSGPLAAVTFKRLQVGDTPLIMDRAGLADRDGNAISTATQNGRVAMPAGQSTVVRPNPLLSSAAVGESVVVTLYVQDVQNLYGADIGLSFDPAVLEVVDANPSVAGVQIQPLDTFLKPDFVIKAKACNVVDPADPDCAVAGRVRYVATQVNPSLPASGSGPLAAVTFKRLQVGDTPLIMDRAGLADRDGNAISAATQNGRVVTPGSLHWCYLPLIMR